MLQLILTDFLGSHSRTLETCVLRFSHLQRKEQQQPQHASAENYVCFPITGV